MVKSNKKENENYVEYRNRVLDPISKSFCGAKWYNATVWLETGQTASCHHPPFHKIPLNELILDFRALHNTNFKKKIRKEMLEGKKPIECEYCWKIEACGSDNVSDRVFKSIIYSDDDLKKAALEYRDETSVIPKTLEVAFDSICNLACSYCNSSFSTRWQNDLEIVGPYQNLNSDGGKHFTEKDPLLKFKSIDGDQCNPYLEAFYEWWEVELSDHLLEFRVTGGEPTASKNFWNFLEWVNKKNKKLKTDLAINTNLATSRQLLARLINHSKYFNQLNIYTSCEAYGAQAEYIRDGLNFEEWISNLIFLINNESVNEVNCMLTINALSLTTLTKFLDEILKIKAKSKGRYPICSFNILRFPSFMSVTTLPEEIRIHFSNVIESWFLNNENESPIFFNEWEKENILRLIDYLRKIEKGHHKSSNITLRQKDFKSFFTQYDKRRGKNFLHTFPEYAIWWDSI